MYDRPSCSDWLNSGKSCPVLYWLRTVLWEGYTDHPENDPMFFSPSKAGTYVPFPEWCRDFTIFGGEIHD